MRRASADAPDPRSIRHVHDAGGQADLDRAHTGRNPGGGMADQREPHEQLSENGHPTTDTAPRRRESRAGYFQLPLPTMQPGA